MFYFLGYHLVPLIVWSIIICIVAVCAGGYKALVAGALFIALHIVFYLTMGIFHRRR